MQDAEKILLLLPHLERPLRELPEELQAPFMAMYHAGYVTTEIGDIRLTDAGHELLDEYEQEKRRLAELKKQEAQAQAEEKRKRKLENAAEWFRWLLDLIVAIAHNWGGQLLQSLSKLLKALFRK